MNAEPYLKPLEWANEFKRSRLNLVRSIYADVFLLLVDIKDHNTDLHSGLSVTTNRPTSVLRPTLKAMAYDTDIQDQKYHTNDEPYELPVQEMLSLVIQKGVYFVCPLRKGMTRESAFQERISVGRARNQDVLLRHYTVSKSHAWFERDEEGAFYVADSGSKNGTTVNGKPIDAYKLIALEAGDRIIFGSVNTVITPAESLWFVLQD
jgi:hypothetical protein